MSRGPQPGHLGSHLVASTEREGVPAVDAGDVDSVDRTEYITLRPLFRPSWSLLGRGRIADLI